MLQSSKLQSSPDPSGMTIETLSAADALHAFAGFGRRQFPVILFVTLLAVVACLIYVMTARPSYTATAQLLIDADKVQLFQKQSILDDTPIDNAQVESQVEVLRSDNLALAVIKNLHLNADPEFVGSGGGLFGAMFGEASNLLGADHAASTTELDQRALRTFQNRLKIKRVGLSYVIQISFESYDSAHAAQIANAIADAYITDQMESKYQATRRASAWLEDRIKELREQVSTAERAVVDFKTKNNIVTTGGPDGRLIGEQEVDELNSQLVVARAASAEAKARLDRINAILSADSPDATVDATVADTLKNDVVSKLRSQYLDLAAREADWSARYGADHLAVVNLRNQMAEIRNSIHQELQRLGETYKSDYDIAKQREMGIQKELAQAVSQSQATHGSQIALGELQSTAQTYKTLYDNFLERYTEAVQQQSFPITEARLISSASPPTGKSHPRTLLDLAIAGLGGMVIGFGLGFIRDVSDRVFRTSEQVEGLLATECIALVPRWTGNEQKQPSGSPKVVPARTGNRRWNLMTSLLFHSSAKLKSLPLVADVQGTIKSTKGKIDALAAASQAQVTSTADQAAARLSRVSAPGPVRTIVNGGRFFSPTIDAPLSRFSEAIRSLKLAIDLNHVVKPSQTMGITSTLPNEGKSTIALALAQLMAQVGKRTILVDCDLRNPAMSRMLAPGAERGLLDVIQGKASLQDVLWGDPQTKMSFLPVVVRSRLLHSNEFLSSSATKVIFEALRESFDYVIADLPPLAPIVDVRAVAPLIDSFVYVVEWGRTRTDVVEHALRHAPDVYENLLGVVLNKVDMDVFRRFASTHESYYYNEYYARYGYTD